MGNAATFAYRLLCDGKSGYEAMGVEEERWLYATQGNEELNRTDE